ncbi:hypothetical protein SAMN05421856_101513 [Chryseobacterium taichungense]|uniref:Uncharacterized protein n=1 Tax=Chryseobacterium taichungense TaxID=295069 RepID=A0A1H7W7A3_9FLAO|nr:hypothetical protein [Chryseobacterium taichungense]SEM16868.1 hypothetical protein SAMN05421856_101513 [Chryseobacterium taichungense]
MIVNIELDNTADFAFIKKLLENIKGIKSVSVEDNEEFYEDGTPKWFIDRLADYADRLEAKDMISEEEFFKYVDEEICRLNSQK